MVVIPRILLFLVAVCACACAAAEPATANPLDQAEVVLRVRDGRWVDREATRFAAAYGGDLALVRGELARVLFRCRGFEGVDLGRPALLAWRPGKAPLLAAIPVSNRNEFLASFGAVERDDPPLVRTGERDGTVIYRQNQPGGEWEYRLLVAGNIAFLARTAEECRRLAVAIGTPAVDPSAAPVELQLRGAGVRSPHLPGADWLTALPALQLHFAELTSVPGLLPGVWNAIADQVATLSLTAQSDLQGQLILNARVSAKPDSALAGWIGQQRPGTERLAGQLRRPGTALTISGRLLFQGQLERWAFDQVDLLRAAVGAGWNDAVDGAFRSLCTLVERSGGFAVALERSGSGVIQQWVLEHPRAIEVVQSVAVLAGSLRGENAQTVKLGDRPAFSLVKGVSSYFVAGDRHAVRVDDAGSKRGAAVAGEVLTRLDEPGSIDAAPALIAMWSDLGLAWNAPAPADGVPADPVIFTAAMRSDGPGRLSCTAGVPLSALGRVLGRLAKTTRND